MTERDRRAGERPGSDEGFLQRWSRRKAEARHADETVTEEPDAAAEAGSASAGETEGPAPGEPTPVAPEDLPDIESLEAGSDFAVFMRPGVPTHLRAQALRKLWRSDPIFSKLDGLVEYGEDYTIQSWPTGMIRTAYQIGRGFVNEIEKLAGDQTAAPEEPPSAPASDARPAIADADPRAAAAAREQPPAPPSKSAISDQAEQASRPAADTPPRRQPRPLPRRG